MESVPPRRIKRVARISGGTGAVSRAEFNRVIALLNERGDILNEMRADLDVQFHRCAQMQAQLDTIQNAWQSLKKRP